MATALPSASRLRWATAACFFVPLALYASTAARTVQGGDSGELADIAWLGGVAHPPGYPLYLLLARMMAHLPFGPPFWRVAMASALAGAAACAVLLRLCARLTGSLGASLVAALAFGISPLCWRLSGVPEVFSFHALFCAAALLLSLHLAESAPDQAPRRSLALGLTLGLGLTNHQTLVLLAPVVLYALLAGWRRTTAARSAMLFLLGGLLGLTPYALLLVAARSAGPASPLWGQTDQWAGVLWHVLRRDYGTLRLSSSAGSGAYDPARHILAFLRALPAQYVYLFFAAGLIGIPAGLRRRPGFAGAVLLSFLLAGIAFLALFNLTDTPTHREVTERFHLMPQLLFAIFIAFGVEAAAARFSPSLIAMLAAAGLVLGAAAAFQSADWARDTSVERFTIAEVSATEPHAIILGRGDTEGSAIVWVTQVLRVHPDVRYVNMDLRGMRWYARRALGELPPDTLLGTIGAAGERLAALSPAYVIPTLSLDAAEDATLEPEGFLDRFVPAGTPPLPLTEEEIRLRRATDLYGVQPPPVDAWAAEIHLAAGYKWLALAEALRKAGDADAAKAADERAQLLLPPDLGT